VADQPGHALNALLVRALLDTPEAWCWDGEAVAEPERIEAAERIAAVG
jgi:UDP-3-O-[3-hydroxymyristoyl] N-acetylglucosamine deacetylase